MHTGHCCCILWKYADTTYTEEKETSLKIIVQKSAQNNLNTGCVELSQITLCVLINQEIGGGAK